MWGAPLVEQRSAECPTGRVALGTLSGKRGLGGTREQEAEDFHFPSTLSPIPSPGEEGDGERGTH